MPTRCPLAQVEAAPAFTLVLPDRPPRVDAPAFAGRLDDLSLPSLLLVLEAERKTGILALTLDPGRGKSALYLRDGRVVRAHLPGQKAPCHAAAVYPLLACTRGAFDFLPYRGIPGDEIGCSTTQLIVEGARRLSAGAEPAPAAAAPGSEGRRRSRRRRLLRGIRRCAGDRGWAKEAVTCFFTGCLFLLLLLVTLSPRPRAAGPSANGAADRKTAQHPPVGRR